MRALGQASVASGRGLLPAILGLVLFGLECSGGEPPKEQAVAGGGAANERAVDLGGGVRMTFLLIPAGTFTMGTTEEELLAEPKESPGVYRTPSPDEKPAHRVTISKAFWMGKYEVTVEQFAKFAEAYGYHTDAERGTDTMSTGAPLGAVHWRGFVRDASWRNPYFKQSKDHPVVCVSWRDTRAFADWLFLNDKARPEGWKYRLPTEAEWEYACRAGTTSRYQWGNDPDKGRLWCNAFDLTAKNLNPGLATFNWDDGFPYTAPVGSFRVNAFGLHDMHGNAAEWCNDWYGPYSNGPQTDPVGPATGEDRVLRGGCWAYCNGDVRSACRRKGHPTASRSDLDGFRLVLAPASK